MNDATQTPTAEEIKRLIQVAVEAQQRAQIHDTDVNWSVAREAAGVAMDAIHTLSRREARLRAHVEAEVARCQTCKGTGIIPLPCPRCTITGGEHEHVSSSKPCPRCASARAALNPNSDER